MRRIAINCGRNSGDGGIVCASITNGPNIIGVKKESCGSQRILGRYEVSVSDAVFTYELGKAGVIVLAGQLYIAAAAEFESVAGRFITIAHPVGINAAADLLGIARISIHVHVLEVFWKYLQQALRAVI